MFFIQNSSLTEVLFMLPVLSWGLNFSLSMLSYRTAWTTLSTTNYPLAHHKYFISCYCQERDLAMHIFWVLLILLPKLSYRFSKEFQRQLLCLCHCAASHTGKSSYGIWGCLLEGSKGAEPNTQEEICPAHWALRSQRI